MTGKLIGSLLPWVPAVALAAIVVGAISLCTGASEKARESEGPVRLLTLDVVEDVVHPGGTATLRNGVCNDSDTPIVVEVYLAAQKESRDPLLQADTIPLIQRPPGSEQGRGATRTLDPGCIVTEPILTTVPLTFPPGRWRLFAEVVWRGPGAEELQRETEFSDYFEVR